MTQFLVADRYNKDTDCPIYTFLDPITQELTDYVIPRGDSFSYFLQRNMTEKQIRRTMEEVYVSNLQKGKDDQPLLLSKEEIKNRSSDKIVSIEKVIKHNMFTEENEVVMRVNMRTALDVKEHRFKTCHEGHIKRITRHALDHRWYMGMPYDNEKLQLIRPDVKEEYIEHMKEMGYPDDIVLQLLMFMFTDIPDVSTFSFDIETEMHKYLEPDPLLASTPILSTGFKFHNVIGTSRPGLVLVLSNELRRLDNNEPNHHLRELVRQGLVELEVIQSEYELIMRTFEVLDNPTYPLCVTHFGEGFDFPYLYNRAINLGIHHSRIPFYAYQTKGGKWGKQWKCTFKRMMHIDMMGFFKQPSVQNYVFKGKYKKYSLEAIAMALLGRGKSDVATNVNEMSLANLAYYNYMDADLSLDLMRYQDFLPWKIIFIFMRIGRQGYYDASQRAIGNKVLNWIMGTLIERNTLIPNKSDLEQVGEGHSQPDIEGKGYRGAIVIPSEQGVHKNLKACDFGCFPIDTEILTINGWKTLQDIKNKPSQLITTINKETKVIEYQQQTMLHEYEYEGDMFNYVVNGGIDLLVTPNHRIIYQKRDRKGGRKQINSSLTWTDKWFIDEAQELNRYWYSIPHFGEWVGKKRNIKIGKFEFTPEQFLPFIGWILADGYITDKYVSISQTRTRYLIPIEDVMKGLGLKFSHTINKKRNEHRFSIHNKEFCTALVHWFNDKIKSKEKHIPREIFGLDKESLQLLFHAMTSGDGSFAHRMGKNRAYTYSSISKQLVSDFQELTLRLGHGCSIREENRTTTFTGYDKVYNVILYIASISYTRKNVINGQKPVKIIPFKGTVWCVTIPNGIIIVRRNGKVCVTGNSLYPTMMKEHNISFDTMNCSHPECRNNIVPELPHHICSKKLGIMPSLIGCMKDIRLEYFKKWAHDKSIPEKEQTRYKAIEQAIKVYVNASYGVGGDERFSLFCKPAAESTTAYARNAITRLAIALENRYGTDLIAIGKQHGVEPLDALEYIPNDEKKIKIGDTDSLYSDIDDDDVEFMIKFSKEQLHTELELEAIIILAIVHKKKNYIFVDELGEITVKGLLGKKRNTPGISVMCFNEFKVLLKDAALGNMSEDEFKNKTIELVRSYYDKIWNKEGDVGDYTIEVQIKRSVSSYGNNQHANASRTWIEYVRSNVIALRNATDDSIVPPMSYIRYTKKAATEFKRSKSGKMSSSVKCTPVPYQLATKDDITPGYYHDNLMSVMGQVMEAMGISPNEVRTHDPENPPITAYL